MNRKLIYLIVLVLVAVNLIMMFKLSAADSNDLSSQLTTDSTRLEMIRYFHTNTVINAQLNNNIRLNGELELIDIDNNSIKLKELVSATPKIIVRSSETGCGSCIEMEMKKIEKFAKIIGDSNIIVVTTHSNVRKLSVFKQTNNVSLRLYISPVLGLPFEKTSEKPFIFLLTTDLNAQNFFIPELTEPELSQAYYTSIYDRYFRPADHDALKVLPSL